LGTQAAMSGGVRPRCGGRPHKVLKPAPPGADCHRRRRPWRAGRLRVARQPGETIQKGLPVGAGIDDRPVGGV